MGYFLLLFTVFVSRQERFGWYLHGSRPLRKDFVAIYVALALFGEILLLFTWLSPSSERFSRYLHGSRPLRRLLSLFTWLSSCLERFCSFTCFSPSSERFCWHSRGFRLLWGDFGAIYMAIVLFEMFLLLFTWLPPS